MDYKDYLQKLGTQKMLVPCLLGCIGGLLLLLLLLTGLCFHLSNRVAVRLVPLHLREPVTVSTNSVDPAYLSMMAVSLASLRLNVTPQTADKQLTLLAHFVAPSNYGALKAQLAHDAKLITTAGLTSSFAISNITLAPAKLAVQLEGQLTRFEGTLALKPVQAKVRLTFDNNNGVLQLRHFDEGHS